MSARMPTDEVGSQETIRERVTRLAFAGDPQRYEEFIRVLADATPEGVEVILRGSSVTGHKHGSDEPFDADGPGTSDLDLTFVGNRILDYYTPLTGFFMPGVHSKPLSKDDPDIAPGLQQLRGELMAMVKRPVNIQGTRDFVMYLRGELLGQAYLTLVEKHD